MALSHARHHFSTAANARLRALALAASLACTPGVRAQDAANATASPAADPASSGGLTTVTIVGRGTGSAGVTGFGDIPLVRTPIQAIAFGGQTLADAGIGSLGQMTRLDASLGGAYNAEGYWAGLSVRGFTVDNRFNYRRDGLPINAETALALGNKERLELLKGASGMQAGTSAPGGLVNLVVKRPTGNLHAAKLEWRQPGSVLGAVDLGGRFGSEGRFGVRLNAEYEHLDPQYRNTKGERSLLALAGDAQLAPGTLLQAEVESSHQRQPSLAGYSMLGNVVPAAGSLDPRRNLNDQPWRQPVEMDGTTASLKLQQRLAEGWAFTAHAMQQRLKSNDRTAFPYGVYDASSYECTDWCDRYAPDGTFTYWQYISDNERRTSSALQLAVSGRARTGAVEHQIEGGVLFTRYRGRFQDQVFDIAGTGNVYGTLATPASPGGTDANTNRDERSTELFLRDAARLGEAWQLWAGLRHTRLNRESQRTSPSPFDNDGLRATQYSQSLTTPWLALSYALGAQTLAYASWGQGMESDVAPSRSRYTNAGQPLPALKSRQVEAGLKHDSELLAASVALFDIDRPLAVDIGACSGAATCTRQIDGSQHHRGVEASASLQLAPWLLQASAMWLHAERRGSSDAAANGQRPVNVPEATLRLGAEYRLAAVPGLALRADLASESDRVVLPYDTGVRIPSWWRLDLGARWRQSIGSGTLTWRVAVDNATNRRAWTESPYQFGHVYLYPQAPRTWRVSAQAVF